MLTARDFVQSTEILDGSNVRRRLRRYEELDRQPPEETARLAREFLDIVSNPEETLVARTLAASILWHCSPSLRILGSAKMALALLQVLEDEFLVADPEALSSCRFPLFKYLVLGIRLMEKQVAEERLRLVAKKFQGSDYGVWLTRFLETGRPGN